MITFIFEGSEKQRLDHFLTEQLPQTRSQIQKLIRYGLVTVNEQVIEVHHWLRNGDVVNLMKESKNKSAENITVDPIVIYEDDEVIVLEKPSGLLVHPTEGHESDTLIDWALSHYPELKTFDETRRSGLMHRLDRDVSGLIIMAKTVASFDNLKRQFQERTIEKYYQALVHGVVSQEEAEINTPLARDSKTGLTKAHSALQDHIETREAITRYEVLQRFHSTTLLKIKLITGRTHQIRVHLQSIGHSLVGDHLYQTKDIRKSKKEYLARPFLHAYHISWMDLKGEQQGVESKLPLDLQIYLDQQK